MNTYLGACVELTPDDVDPHVVTQRPKVTYLEGYLWDPPLGQAGLPEGRQPRPWRRAADRADAVRIPSACSRYLTEFQDLVKKHVDILFANEVEIKAALADR